MTEGPVLPDPMPPDLDPLAPLLLGAAYGLPAWLLPDETVEAGIREAVAVLREHEPEALENYRAAVVWVDGFREEGSDGP